MNFFHTIIASMLYLYTIATVYATEERMHVKINDTDADYHFYTIDEGITLYDSKQTEDQDLSSKDDLYDLSNGDNTTENNLSLYSEEFLSCLVLTLEPEHYEELENGSVYVPKFDRLFNKSNYLIQNGILKYCPQFYKDLIDTEKFSSEISIVSIVCVCISAFCITLHKIMFVLVKKMRNLPGYVLLSLCVALQCAYVCSSVQFFVREDMNCVVIGMFMLYFFLSSFFWMNTMSYDVWRSIRMATNKLRLNSDKSIMVRLARYSVYAWGAPLMIIIISIVVHHTSDESSKYKLNFNMDNCWFAYKDALTVYFAIPLFVLLGMNVIFFVSSLYMILGASMSKSQSGSPESGSDLWPRLFLSMRLGSVMGFMWIFGIIAAFTEQEWLWYLYAICNALQGVFIFFSFTVSERTRKLCIKAFKGKKFSFGPTQTSSQPSTTH